MRTLLLVVGVAAEILYHVYQWYVNREIQQAERPYGSSNNAFSGDEDYIIINETKAKTRSSPQLPSKDDVCGICLDPLIRRNPDEKPYAIVALPRCHHWFHKKCANRLIDYHPNCPVCREHIDHAALRGTPVRVIDSLEETNSTQGSSSVGTKRDD